MRKTPAAALAAFVSLLLPVFASAAPAIEDTSGVPVANGEQAARSCYLNAQGFWNRTMATAPRDRRSLNDSYREFAGCAKIAIVTGKTLPNGERLPWFTDYFASTVGATYAQLQLAAVTKSPEQCRHLSLAHDLAEQAMETESGFTTPQVGFEADWQTLTDNVRQHAMSCGAKGISG